MGKIHFAPTLLFCVRIARCELRSTKAYPPKYLGGLLLSAGATLPLVPIARFGVFHAFAHESAKAQVAPEGRHCFGETERIGFGVKDEKRVLAVGEEAKGIFEEVLART